MKTILYSILALVAVVLIFSFFFPEDISNTPRTTDQITSKDAYKATKDVMRDYLKDHGYKKYSLSNKHTAVDMGTAHWLINSAVTYKANGQKLTDKYHIELKWDESTQGWVVLQMDFTPKS